MYLSQVLARTPDAPKAHQRDSVALAGLRGSVPVVGRVQGESPAGHPARTRPTVGKGRVAMGIAALFLSVIVAVAVWARPGGPASPGAPSPVSTVALGFGEPAPPSTMSTSRSLGNGGGLVANTYVTVAVPGNAWGPSSSGTVELGAPMGVSTGPFAKELWGAPVGVKHSRPFAKPLKVTWDVSKLPRAQQDTLTLVHWDGTIRAWQVADAPVSVKRGKATATISTFSFVDWVSNAGPGFDQALGASTGRLTGAPTCSKAPLPRWVQQVVRPDEHLTATAIRTCVEIDTRTGGLTIQVANNRSHTQGISLAPRGTDWSWVWDGAADHTPSGTVSSVAHSVYDTKTRAIMPPGRTMAFGLRRPARSGSTVVTMSAQANAATVFSDVVAMALADQSIGGSDDPVMTAFIQGVDECGGKELLASRPGDAGEAVSMALDAARNCTSAVVGGGSTARSDEVMIGVEKALRSQIAEGGSAATRAVEATRLLHQVADELHVLRIADLAEYAGDRLTDALGERTTLSVRLIGTPPRLGAWAPLCTDVRTDSETLYKNLVLQDQFSDRSQEFWQFPGWRFASATAVHPLAGCDTTYRQRIAEDVANTWTDKRAAQVVVTALRSLDSSRGPFVGEWARHDFYVQLGADGTATIGQHGCTPMLNGACDIESSARASVQGRSVLLTVTNSSVVNADGSHGPVPEGYWTQYGSTHGSILWGGDGDTLLLTMNSVPGLVDAQLTYQVGGTDPGMVLCGSDPAGKAQLATGICGA